MQRGWSFCCCISCTGEKGDARSEIQLRRRSSAFESLLYEKKQKTYLFVAHVACSKPRDTIYSHDPFTLLGPQRIKWFPVYSNGQLLYPQGTATLMVNMADIQTRFAEVVCLLGCPAAVECPAFGNRRLPGNSQMLEHGRGLVPPHPGIRRQGRGPEVFFNICHVLKYFSNC